MGELEAAAVVRWVGWNGEVSGASGALAARTATQTELGGPGTGTNPEELLAAAHANCFTSTLTAIARARGISLESVETRARTRLAWSDGAHDHRLAGTELAVTIATSSDAAAVRALVAETERECPVCKALAGTVPLTVEVDVRQS